MPDKAVRSKRAEDLRRRLFKLVEELGEAQQAIGKVLVHGADNYNPSYVLGRPTNMMVLEEEIGHVLAVLDIMEAENDLSLDRIRAHSVAKRRVLHEQYGY